MSLASLRNRASAFWLAWKWIVLLLIALGGSVWLNLIQWRNAFAAPIKHENAALTHALDRISDLELGRAEDDSKTAAQVQAIADRIPTDLIGYLDRAARRPLGTGCEPGQERQDDVNRILGADGP